MSAYALPGVIFPPTSGFGFVGNETPSSGSVTDSKDKRSDTLSPTFHIKPVPFSTAIASDIALDFQLKPSEIRVSEKVDTASDFASQSKEINISVKEAKIDPKLLMDSLISSQKVRKRESNSSQIKNPRRATDPCDYKDDPHEKAIEFELSISFNGRTYTARRTLPRIIQLRNDLVSEMKNRGRKLQMRQMRWLKKRNHHRRKYIDHDELTVQTVVDEVESDDEDSVTIPELPQYFNEEGESSGRFAARGFSKLQLMMRSYRPVIEGWLLRVTDIVSPTESPSLSTFLWEPLSKLWLEPIEEGVFEEGSDSSQEER